VVICGKSAVTWFVSSTNQRHSAFLIPHFTFRIPQFRILPIACIGADSVDSAISVTRLGVKQKCPR